MIWIGSALTGKGGFTMAKLDKVVIGLDCCKRTDGRQCKFCPYTDSDSCVEDMATDALGLIAELKAQIHGLTEQIANGGGNG